MKKIKVLVVLFSITFMLNSLHTSVFAAENKYVNIDGSKYLFVEVGKVSLDDESVKIIFDNLNILKQYKEISSPKIEKAILNEVKKTKILKGDYYSGCLLKEDSEDGVLFHIYFKETGRNTSYNIKLFRLADSFDNSSQSQGTGQSNETIESMMKLLETLKAQENY